MDHDDDETAAKEGLAKQPSEAQDDDQETNQLKRRNSDEADGEKRLRENDEPPSGSVTASPDLDNDPQMQVSSLDSDYNEVAVPEDLKPLQQDGLHPSGGMDGPVPTDFDVNAKLREMGEISVQSVSKNELPKRSPDEEEPTDEVSLTKRPKEEEANEKQKVTNLRKNIREVIDDTMLDASTLAAQREEQERLNRVQEQQRILRAQQRQNDLDKRQNSILSLLQGKLDPSEDLSGPSVSISAVRVLDKKTGQILEEIPDQTLEPGEIPNPLLCTAQLKEAQMADRLGEVGEKKDVVTIDDSSDDDCIMLSDEEEEPDGDDDPHNSGLHVNDSYNVPDDQGRVLINFGHSDTEQDVFVAPQIARALKPHQIGGIRFLYDNIIESLDRFDSSTGFGCILAHSMGLGKTLQLVCFCDIFLRHTNAKTILCIMPINTLQNWLAEFNWWLPEDGEKSPLKEFGPVRGRNFKIHVLNDSQKTITARSKVVLNWSRTGGVLLIGYELYRLLCLKKVVKKKGKRAERDPVYAEKEQAAHGELLEEIYEALVKPGPDLVVCDEGHRIKSSHASTSVALKQIRTKRRIVLTGYPLQNNLLEYWCMVDFVRPNYLGTKTEFCNMFEKPIQNGQCIDSTPQDIKLMRYRAHVLHSLLLGFVQRRSHLVLQSTLPNKLEYVMLVRMTAYQRKLYDVFMNEVVRKKAVPNPLKAFAVCCKIWNHPDVLYNFLKKREADLDLELEEELAMAEAKKKRKEREKKAKEEEIAQNGDRGKADSSADGPLIGQSATIPSATNESLVPKEEPFASLNANYQNTGMAQYGQPTTNNNNAYGGGVYNANTTDHLDGSEGAYDPFGNNNYYSAYNNHHSYQSADLVGGGTSTTSTEYDNHQQHHHNQYYNNNQAGISMNADASTAGKAKESYWGNNVAGTATMGGMNNYYGAGNQTTNSVQYSQNYSMATGASGPNGSVNLATDIPTTVAAVSNSAVDHMPKENMGEEKTKTADETPIKGDVFKEPASPPEKELKSSKDDGIPYEWAVELMKDYVPDLLENAPKMEIFFCILNESLAVGDRILVFSQSLLTLNLIERYLQKNKVFGKEDYWSKNTNYFRLDGSTTACDRERLINEFNTNDEVAIFLVSTRAGSLGINLVGANRVIVFDASWNPCHDTQAVCRVYRYGQKKQCYVYRMVMDNCLEKRIYDRQVNKQGMSDRVVDECNPDAHLSIKEVTNLCWDNDEETEVKDFNDVKDQYPDVVMQKVLENFSKSLSKEPFRHESLLVDRKEKKLSMAEKRLAQRGYELEKQASTKTAYNYSGKVTQYRVFRTADGALVHRPVGSVQTIAGSGTATVGVAPSSKWIPAEVWQQQGMTTQETTLPADVTIPSNSSDKNGGILLKAGQKVMILKSSKGVYMQLETGKIIAIRTGPKNTTGSHSTMNVARPRGFGDVNEVIKLDDDDDDDEELEEGEVPTKSTKLKNKVVIPKEEPQKKNIKEGNQNPINQAPVEVAKPAIDPVAHSYQIPGQASSGYFNNSTNYSSGSYNSGTYRQQQFDVSDKNQSTSRDYNSYPSGSNSSTYDGRVSSAGGDYQQKSYGQSTHDLPSQSTLQVGPHGGSSAYGGRGGSYGSHYGNATTAVPEQIASNGHYGAQPVQQPPQQQQQHRSSAPVAAAAAAVPPPAYPQSSYDYSNRYYDTQTKPLAPQYNTHPSHYPAPASAYPMSQSVYSNAYQYGQHRPGEYNPNNPPYYMTPFAGAASSYPSQPYGQGQHQQQTQQPQPPIVQNLPPNQQQPQQLQQQAPVYPEGNGSYGGSYASQYNGPSSAMGHLGKVDPPAATGTSSKRKESSSSKKKSESAFHKPNSADVPEIKAEKKEAIPSTNYYDRAMAASSTYSGYSPAYLGGPSPYNYPPSSYFYPTSYCAPNTASTTATDPATVARDVKESKGNGTDSGAMGKYYELNRTTPQHYHPPKW